VCVIVSSTHEHLVVLPGGVRDPDLVDRAVEGQDAVICAFEPRALGKDDIQEVLMRNLVAAMTKRGVKRLVNLSAWGAQDMQKPVSLMQVILQGVLLRNIFADKKRGEKVLFASDVEYVNVCPGRLLNKPARGGIQASAEGTGIKHSITRADLAQWMVDQLTSDTWVRASPIIG